ncbi:MAG TPA: DUF1580 domain-containing protein [Planctomycetaceae bacterium]|jgi:hypothetical protein|nr:DUF1580 domain-containing protein [Planctomycetaceae bacterium]
MTTDYSELLSLSEVSRLLPSKPNPATLWRWHKVGCYGIRLKTLLVGGRRFCERREIDAFIERVTQARETHASTPVTAEHTAETHRKLAAADLLEPIKRRGRPRKQPASR